MSPEPHKSIEELLQASAEARRVQYGRDASMPNPMRAQLHEEISRAARVEESPVRTSWLAAYWPRVVIGAAVAALVIGFPMMWWRADDQAGDAGRYAILEQAAPAAESAVLDAVVTERAEALKMDDAAEAEHARERFADTTRPPPPAQPQTTAEIAGAGMAAPAEAEKRDVTRVRQQFTQTPAGMASRGNLQTARAAEVLNTFQVEQEGETIRIIDGDGSTYTGTVRVAAQAAGAAAGPSMKQESALAAPAAPRARAASGLRKATGAAPLEFTFRASGYNASLQKEVVFEGNYIAPAPPPALSQRGGGPPEDEERAARVIGTAKIPGEAPVPVDAAAAPPAARR